MIRDKFQAMGADLSAALIDRDKVVMTLVDTLIAGEHAVLLGPPGTAKSMLIRELCSRIDGGVYFERLLTKFSVPEELFGPLSLAALEQDRYERITKGSLVEANIAFLDEIFKANSAILNSLLTLINERLYHEAGAIKSVPLLSMFGASNETPEDDGLGALYDRFLVKIVVPYLTDEQSFKNLLIFEAQPPKATITMDDLCEAQIETKAVLVSEDGLGAIVEIKRKLETEGITASDRRWRSAIKLLKARAWREGKQEIRSEHCEALTDVLWQETSQIRVVEREVARVCNPIALEAVELEDAARDLYEQRPDPGAPNVTQMLEPLLQQIGDINERLEAKLGAVAESKRSRGNEAIANIQKWHGELSRMALASLSRLHLAPGTRR